MPRPTRYTLTFSGATILHLVPEVLGFVTDILNEHEPVYACTLLVQNGAACKALERLSQHLTREIGNMPTAAAEAVVVAGGRAALPRFYLANLLAQRVNAPRLPEPWWHPRDIPGSILEGNRRNLITAIRQVPPVDFDISILEVDRESNTPNLNGRVYPHLVRVPVLVWSSSGPARGPSYHADDLMNDDPARAY